MTDDHKAEATEKFKVISAVHSILSNKSKRELYDKTGNFRMILFRLNLCHRSFNNTSYLARYRFCG